MKRIKFFLGPILFVALISILYLNADKPLVKEDFEVKSNPINIVESPVISAEEIALYHQRREAIEKELKSYFKRQIKSGAILGAGISIVQGDSILFAGGFGKRKANLDVKVNGETVFRLGSLSKGFGGVLTAKLKSERVLDYNDLVSDYISDFQLGQSSESKNISISNILSHSSGTPYHSYTDLVESGMSLSKIAPRFSKVNAISKPGELYSYQNAMFALSGEIMERSTGKSIGNLFKEKLFVPLKMTTASSDDKSLRNNENIAFPHRKYKKYFKSVPLSKKYYNAVTAGGINASALDMAKWMRFLIGKNPEVLEQDCLNDVFTPVVEIKGKRKYYQRWPGHVSSHYGYGWRIHNLEDKVAAETTTIYHHGGSVNQYRNEIAIFPDQDLGICVLFNSTTKLAKTVIIDLKNIIDRIDDSINTESKVLVTSQ